MRGKIACSADRLGLLEAAMISSVVEPKAFQIGKQYQAERRVQLTDASDTELTSSVMGNSGLYEQTIRLANGNLEAKCSCTLPEQPMCRHGVAALLEYQRWSNARIVPKARPSTLRPQVEPAAATAAPSSDVKLGELTQFTEWMQRVVQAIQGGQPVPEQPNIQPGLVSTWTHIIQQLDERRRESEFTQIQLDSDVRSREATVARLTQDLEVSVKEAKSLQAICHDLQREVEQQKAVLNKTADLSRHIEQFEGEVKAIATLVTEKGRRLEGLSGTCRDVASMLKALGKA
ncbi:MAG: hypothetical protein KF848_06570 [Nitrospira sp.]|nr:hypothetical protein [Nitrospira sp.]